MTSVMVIKAYFWCILQYAIDKWRYNKNSFYSQMQAEKISRVQLVMVHSFLVGIAELINFYYIFDVHYMCIAIELYQHQR